MSLPAIITLAVIVIMIFALALELISADFILFFSLTVLIVFGVVSPKDALVGFSNTGMLTVAALFIISSAIENTGAMNYIVDRFLTKKKEIGYTKLLLRLMMPVSFLSAWLNNTPMVVMLTPVVKKWAESIGLSPSKFLIPLSYATIFGGICTLIGTSTNLVVHGMMQNYTVNGVQLAGFGFFELAKIGIPLTVIGWLYIAFIGKHLLPARKDIYEQVNENRKEYMVEMLVQKGSSLIGTTARDSGLLNLKDLYTVEIVRKGQILDCDPANEVICERDRLMIFGGSNAILEVSNMPNLVPVDYTASNKNFESIRDQLVETVVSPSSPILGKRIKDAAVEKLYGANIVAIHRNGVRIKSRLRNVRLRAGDSLLLLAAHDFKQKFNDSMDFHLVTHVKTVYPLDPRKTIIALVIMILMVLGATLGQYLPEVGGQKLGMLHFAFLAALLMVTFKIIKVDQARKALHLDVLIVIACAFGISAAIQDTGAASAIAKSIIGLLKNWGAIGVLGGVYLITVVFTEIITNNAAAALMCPIAFAVSQQMGLDPKPFFVAIAVAASSSFATPIGYQTNMIIQGPGGYKFMDYVKVGIPLNLLFFTASMFIIPYFWPLIPLAGN